MKAQRTAALARRRQTEDASRLTDQDAVRLVDQAAFGVRPEEAAAVKTMGYRAWVEDQLTKTSVSPIAVIPGFRQGATQDWFGKETLLSGALLHPRVIHALQNFIILGGTVALYFDDQLKFNTIYHRNAFGNFRTLLFEASTSWLMGKWLTFFGNKKASATVQPDENYAREVMQLFSIGLWELNLDGTRVKAKELPLTDPRYIANSNANVPTYTLADVKGLARVWTGWGPRNETSFDSMIAPNESWEAGFFEAQHETGEKTFLRTTIPAGTLGVPTMNLAIDTIFAQPSLPPFFCKQMIQRLVTSNPSPEYVARVASVFVNNGAGVRGDLKSVWRAILLDAEARSIYESAKPTYGKLREPYIDFMGLVRTYVETPATLAPYIAIGTNEAGNFGFQILPFNQRSVFNDFKASFQPRDLIASGLVVPEMEAHGENFALKKLAGIDGLLAFNNVIGTSTAAEDTYLDIDEVNSLSATPEAMIDYICKLANVTFSSARKTALINYITSIPVNAFQYFPTKYLDATGHGRTVASTQRASSALNAIYQSPERITQK